MDAESNGCISFLDVQVQRHNSSLSTSVFRKTTHTNKYLNYNSHHHARVLSGIVKCLRQRAINMCNPENKQTELSHLRRVFLVNGYPADCIDSLLYKKQKHHHSRLESTTNQVEHFLCLPYVRGISEKIEHLCRSIRTVKIRVAFKPMTILQNILTDVKNKIPQEKKKAEVYTIPCHNCNTNYVGETGRTLQKRIEEHKSAVRRGDEKNGIAVHVKKTQHDINWAEAIQSQINTMNLDCGLN